MHSSSVRLKNGCFASAVKEAHQVIDYTIGGSMELVCETLNISLDYQGFLNSGLV